MYLPVFILILCYQKKYRLEKNNSIDHCSKKVSHCHISLFSPLQTVLNWTPKLSAPPPGGIADNPSEPAPWPHHPLSWPWHQWQPIDLCLNPFLPVDSPTGGGCTHSFVKRWWAFSFFFWELVHVSVGWNRLLKCDYWCAQSLGYCCRWTWCRDCSDLMSLNFTAFPPLLQHISMLYCQSALETPCVLVTHFFFHFQRFNTPYPPLCFPGIFQMIPKQNGRSHWSLL